MYIRRKHRRHRPLCFVPGIFLMLLLLAPHLSAQRPVLFFNLYHQGEEIRGGNPDWTIRMYDEIEGTEIPLVHFDVDSSYIGFGMDHVGVPPEYPYCLEVTGLRDTMELHIRTYFMGWRETYLLIGVVPGRFELDLFAVPEEKRGHAPIRARDYWKKL